jgi:hypothetical protein
MLFPFPVFSLQGKNAHAHWLNLQQSIQRQNLLVQKFIAAAESARLNIEPKLENTLEGIFLRLV